MKSGECSTVEDALRLAQEWLEEGESVRIDPLFYGQGLRPAAGKIRRTVADAFRVYTEEEER